MKMNDVILAPVLSEKTNVLREADPKVYVFKVARKANKIMVMQAVHNMFKVNPVACRIINVRGKVRNNRAISKNSFRRGKGQSAAWKKAMVTLNKGQKIEIFEGA